MKIWHIIGLRLYINIFSFFFLFFLSKLSFLFFPTSCFCGNPWRFVLQFLKVQERKRNLFKVQECDDNENLIFEEVHGKPISLKEAS